MYHCNALVALADRSDGDVDDYDPLPGRTQEQIEALILNFDEVVETVATYASLMSVLLILLALALSMKLSHWLRFIFLTMASLIWFAFYEQYTTSQFWIGLAVGYTSLVIAGLVLVSLHFLQTAVAIAPGSRLSILRPVLIAASALPWVVLGLKWPITDGTMPIVMALLGGLAYLCHAVVISARSGSSFFRRRNYVAIAAALLLIGIATLGELDEGFDASFAVRLAFVAIVALSTLLLVQQVIAILRERDASVRQSLAAAKREAEQSMALLEAEKNYSRAQEIAKRHTMRLATASHDIRQPIVSLRGTMAAVTQDQPQEIKNQLAAAFDYLDSLAASYLETENAENAPLRDASAAQDGTEVVSTRMLCDTLGRMFRKEAEAKGLIFSVTVEEIDLRVQPLVVTRILSNLLSNAVKHTSSGKVTLAGAGDVARYIFSVRNSAPLPEGFDVEQMFVPFVKGESSEGYGLGLSIAQSMACAHGFSLNWSSDMDSGTEFRLTVETDKR
ncbi:HAMP domain-containing sensor histidine kinase [Sulfitobacter sp. F26204]|uniref:sensor histidine kinase n=1 Tax=Sulfitobacter sp. F26204 TaxID=2996014 RepID=UPI00225E037F|nr:HAMP domain-containing sensor histidine kinase [Sulfitobacter sp. F26204]MCX7561319.1 HAMP domain-containing sensor histidine kinase [Sulfitobacter sp. F26204]